MKVCFIPIKVFGAKLLALSFFYVKEMALKKLLTDTNNNPGVISL